MSVSCGAYGTQSGSTTFTAGQRSWQLRLFFPDGPASSTVSVQVKDSDNDNSNLAELTVAIANVAPTVVLSGPATADEGQTKTYTYTATDPGADTLVITESCGANGVRTDTPAVNSFDCTFPDGPANSTVKVTADDGDLIDNIGDDEIVVAIANVAPTVVLSGPATADEGQTKTYTYTATDPGADNPGDHRELRRQRRPDRHARRQQLRLHLPRRAGQLDGQGDRRRRRPDRQHR